MGDQVVQDALIVLFDILADNIPNCHSGNVGALTLDDYLECADFENIF